MHDIFLLLAKSYLQWCWLATFAPIVWSWWKKYSWEHHSCSSWHAVQWSDNIWNSFFVKIWVFSNATSCELFFLESPWRFAVLSFCGNWNILFIYLFILNLCWKLLEHITFVDTPGVLSGEKQRTQRAYDFTGVTSWFAAKCDLILLLFDPHKLDVSDEFKRVIASLRGHDDKIRVVLNKADQIDTQQVRVFAAKWILKLAYWMVVICLPMSLHCSWCVFMEH